MIIALHFTAPRVAQQTSVLRSVICPKETRGLLISQ